MLRAYRGNVDDRAAFAGIYHLPNRCAHRVEGAAGGDREHVVPLLLSDLHELGLATISGAIDKHIDRTQFGGGSLEGGDHLILAGKVAANDDGLATQLADGLSRSEEHTSELQSLMRISYAVFCLKKKK